MTAPDAMASIPTSTLRTIDALLARAEKLYALAQLGDTKGPAMECAAARCREMAGADINIVRAMLDEFINPPAKNAGDSPAAVLADNLDLFADAQRARPGVPVANLDAEF